MQVALPTLLEQKLPKLPIQVPKPCARPWIMYKLFHGLGAAVDAAVEAGVERSVLLAARASSKLPPLYATSRDVVIAPRSQELSRRKESQLQQTVMQGRA